MQQQWKDMHRRYFDGLIEQVKQTSEGRTFTRSVHEYIEMRRRTIGAYPAIALAAYLGLSSCMIAAADVYLRYGLNVKVPSHIFEHPSLQECMHVAADLVHL